MPKPIDNKADSVTHPKDITDFINGVRHYRPLIADFIEKKCTIGFKNKPMEKGFKTSVEADWTDDLTPSVTNIVYKIKLSTAASLNREFIKDFLDSFGKTHEISLKNFAKKQGDTYEYVPLNKEQLDFSDVLVSSPPRPDKSIQEDKKKRGREGKRKARIILSKVEKRPEQTPVIKLLEKTTQASGSDHKRILKNFYSNLKAVSISGRNIAEFIQSKCEVVVFEKFPKDENGKALLFQVVRNETLKTPDNPAPKHNFYFKKEATNMLFIQEELIPYFQNNFAEEIESFENEKNTKSPWPQKYKRR